MGNTKNYALKSLIDFFHRFFYEFYTGTLVFRSDLTSKLKNRIRDQKTDPLIKKRDSPRLCEDAF